MVAMVDEEESRTATDNSAIMLLSHKVLPKPYVAEHLKSLFIDKGGLVCTQTILKPSPRLLKPQIVFQNTTSTELRPDKSASNGRLLHER